MNVTFLAAWCLDLIAASTISLFRSLRRPAPLSCQICCVNTSMSWQKTLRHSITIARYCSQTQTPSFLCFISVLSSPSHTFGWWGEVANWLFNGAWQWPWKRIANEYININTKAFLNNIVLLKLWLGCWTGWGNKPTLAMRGDCNGDEEMFLSPWNRTCLQDMILYYMSCAFSKCLQEPS